MTSAHETSIDNDIVAAARNVIKGSSFALSELGFVFGQETVDVTAQVGSIYSFHLKSNFSPIFIHLVAVNESRLWDNIPVPEACNFIVVKSEIRFFSMPAYFAYNNILYDADRWNIRNYKGSAVERITQFLEFTTHEMMRHVRPILAGQSWDCVPSALPEWVRTSDNRPRKADV